MMVPRAYTYRASSPKSSRSLSPSNQKAEKDAKTRVKKEKDKSKSEDTVGRDTVSRGIMNKDTVRKGDRDVVTLGTRNLIAGTDAIAPGKPKSSLSPPTSTPSQPMSIPARASNGPRRRLSKSSQRTIRSRPSIVSDEEHDPHALTPSTAALLAVTSISPSASRQLATGSKPRSIAGAMRGEGRLRRSISRASPKSWSILQSAPEDPEEDAGASTCTETVGSLTSDRSSFRRNESFRSASSESIPSLEAEQYGYGDLDSPNFDPLPTPRTSSSRCAKSPRRERTKLSTSSELLGEGELHPLSLPDAAFAADEVEGMGGDGGGKEELYMSVVVDAGKSKSTPTSTPFKSNLTASLQRLRSAAVSITPSSISKVLAPLTPENVVRHPKPSSTLSTTISAPSSSSSPSLSSPSSSLLLPIMASQPQRSLPPRPSSAQSPHRNPITSTAWLSPRLPTVSNSTAADLYFSPTPSEEYRPISASIQLQPFTRQNPRTLTGDNAVFSDRATAPPIFLPALNSDDIGGTAGGREAGSSMGLLGVKSPRPREPRENSDFLRVVVLEMNMRRKGKLRDGLGRARIWLGPRDGGKKQTPGIVDGDVASAIEEAMADGDAEAKLDSEDVGEEHRSDTQTARSKDVDEGGYSTGKTDVPKRWIPSLP